MPLKLNTLIFFATALFFEMNAAQGSDCLNLNFEQCLKKQAFEKISQSSELQEIEKNNLKKHLEKQDHATEVLPSMFFDYHHALLKVLPEKSRETKKEIINYIVRQKQKEQTDLLINLAIIEAFSGDISAASHTISYASKTNSSNSKTRIVAHVIEQTSSYIQETIKPLGYQHVICNDPTLQIQTSLAIAANQHQQSFLQLIHSIPDDNLKISILMYTSTYAENVNRCQFLSHLFEENIFQIINSQKNTEQAITLANNAILLNRLLH